MDETLYVFPNIHDYCIYELESGWYYNYHLSKGMNGAPDLLDYIDIDALGRDLLDIGGLKYSRLLPNGKVVTAKYGWYV